MTYYLTATAKQKNAKRHIFYKGSLEACESHADILNKRYTVEIYDGRWQLVKFIRKGV